VVTGNNFVGLVRLIFFVSRWACTIFASELRVWGLLLGSRTFLFGRCEGTCFVELARLIVLFTFGFAQFFVGDDQVHKCPKLGLLY
jgi:hypothetical protein